METIWNWKVLFKCFESGDTEEHAINLLCMTCKPFSGLIILNLKSSACQQTSVLFVIISRYRSMSTR